MKKETARGYLSFLKMMRECMGQGTVEAQLLRDEVGMTGKWNDDLFEIGMKEISHEEQLSWYYWFSLAMLTPILRQEMQRRAEKYETEALTHVLVLEILRARLDAWRYGIIDRDEMERYTPQNEAERQRAALDFAIRAFEEMLQRTDLS